MVAEGLHLDNRGLNLLLELAQLEQEIKSTRKAALPFSEIRISRITARKVLARREAKSHCQQAGISWDDFQAALKKR